MTPYSFTTSFQIKSPSQEVWKTLLEYEKWPDWWMGVREMRVTKKTAAPLLHVSIGYPFYALKLMLQITHITPGKVIRFTTSGDLIGDGTFYLKAHDSQTDVTFDWNVATPKMWMNIVAKVAKPVFEFSHNLVMHWFVSGLAKQLHTITSHEKYITHKTTTPNTKVAPVLEKE